MGRSTKRRQFLGAAGAEFTRRNDQRAAGAWSDVGTSGWIRACVFGELVGFIPPAIVGASLYAVGAPEIVLVFGLVAAGVAEGVVLGHAQARVVTTLLPEVVGWTRATAIAAGIAWLAGMGGSALVQHVGPIALIVVAPAWLIGLLSMGLLQARRLAPAVDDARDWVAVTTVGWLIGVALPVIALSIIPNSWPLPVHVLAAVVAAVAMGATVGAVSAPTLRRLAETRV